MREFLDNAAATEQVNQADANPRLAARIKMLYYPQLGYLCVLPLDLLEAEFPGADLQTVVPFESWSFQFSATDVVAYQTPVTQSIAEEFGDIGYQLLAAETAVLDTLVEQVRMEEAVLLAVGEI